MSTEPLLRIEGLTKHFPVRSGLLGRQVGAVRAVDEVDLDIAPGSTLGLVGESGCGKTTLGRCIVRAHDPTSGRMLYRRPDGSVIDVATLKEKELKPYRAEVRMIFQDPHSSLNPRKTLREIIGEPMRVHGYGTPDEIAERVGDLLERVGLRREYASRYPHAFSGGQRQRVGIARALAAEPSVLLSDEATSALDPGTTQSILALLKRLNTELGLTILLITHEMNVVKSVCDSVAIMSRGRIEESGAIADLIRTPGSRLTREIFPLPEPAPAGSVTLTFTGDPRQPVVSEVVRKFDVDLSILGGSIEDLAGGSVGRLRVVLDGSDRQAALAYLRDCGLIVEEAGEAA